MFTYIVCNRALVWWWLPFGSLKWEGGKMDFPHSLCQTSITAAPCAPAEKSLLFLFPGWVSVRVFQWQVGGKKPSVKWLRWFAAVSGRGEVPSRAITAGRQRKWLVAAAGLWDALGRTAGFGLPAARVAASLGFLLNQIFWEQTSPALLNSMRFFQLNLFYCTSCLLFFLNEFWLLGHFHLIGHFREKWNFQVCVVQSPF